MGQRKILNVLIILFACNLCVKGEIITFDFTTPDSEGKIFGYPVPNNRNYIGSDVVFTVGNVEISFEIMPNAAEPNLNEVLGPVLKKYNNNGTFEYYMEFGYMCGAGNIVFKTTDESRITKIEAEYFPKYRDTWTNSLEEWSCDTGKFTNDDHSLWEGKSTCVKYLYPQQNNSDYTRIARIKVSTTNCVVENISSAQEFEQGGDVKFNCELICKAHSKDGKYILVTDGKDVMYLHSASGLKAIETGVKINPGVAGTISDIDGILCIEVNNESVISQNYLAPTRIYLSQLNDSYVGKLVKIYGGIIKNVGGTTTLNQGGTVVLINNLVLDSNSTPDTTENYVEVIGDLGKSGPDYVIHPISVVKSLFTSEDSISKDVARVGVRDGIICILGDFKTSSVYNVDGVLIASDKSEIECGSGIYIVTVDGASYKVYLR